MKKKVISGLLIVTLMICGFMGVNNFVPEQRSITISSEAQGNEAELVAGTDASDSNASDKKASAASVHSNADVRATLAETESVAEFEIQAKSAVLMDAESGKVLFAQSAEQELPPASVTKIMTMLLILEGVEQGRISLDDAVTVSETAASMGGSQMYMEPGEQHTVEELLMGVAMVSANDGTVALAEHLCGSVEIFVEKMNSRARELGMKNSNFVNTNGLPAENHYSSAYDIAVMTSELLKHESSHEWLTKKQAMIKVGLPGKEKDFELLNTNKLLYQYEGALGVKTGFTQDAMFCLSGAAERNGMRLVAVVLGAESSAVRFSETKKLLDYGFANYESYVVAKKGECQKKYKVAKATPEKVTAVAVADCRVLIRKGESDKITTKVEMKGNLKAPLKKGKEIGELVVYQQGVEIERFPLVAEEALRKATLWERITRWVKGLLPG